MSKYIIGDPHACFQTLIALIDKIKADGGKLEDIVVVGDLVDRGPDAMAVVEYVKSHKIDCVLGNHEQMMIDYSEDNEYRGGVWEMNGGYDTLQSYKKTPEIFKEHVEFIKSLPLFLEYPEVKNAEGRYLVVSHSYIGTVPTRKELLNPKLKNSILWDRYPPLTDAKEIYNVIGHTVKENPDIRAGWANVDTGCVFKDHRMYGNLTALKFPEMTVIQQKNIETEGFYVH